MILLDREANGAGVNAAARYSQEAAIAQINALRISGRPLKHIEADTIERCAKLAETSKVENTDCRCYTRVERQAMTNTTQRRHPMTDNLPTPMPSSAKPAKPEDMDNFFVNGYGTFKRDGSGWRLDKDGKIYDIKLTPTSVTVIGPTVTCPLIMK